MKSIRANYDRENQQATIQEGAKSEDWVKVCARYNDDVHRILDVKNIEGFTALYRCFDEDNREIFYLVSEDKNLFRLKRRHFLRNIGKAD